MANSTDDKLKKMEDEMNRFEAEIALPLPPSTLIVPRQVIGSNTYNRVQRRLEEQQTVPLEFGGMPCFPSMIAPAFPGTPASFPPPPPPPFLVPQQVQRNTPRTGHSSQAYMPMNPFMPEQMLPNISSIPGVAVLTATPKLYQVRPTVLKAPPPRIEELRLDASDKYRKKITPGKALAERTLSVAEKANEILHTNKKIKASTLIGEQSKKKENKNKKMVRSAAGQVWEDNSLMDWEEDDFRIFCGDLGDDVTDEVLARAFSKYSSFLKVKVVRDKRSNKTKGFGFVSFKDSQDFIKAMKEMNGRYVGSRPIKLRKSTWRSRNIETVKKKNKEKKTLIAMITGKH